MGVHYNEFINRKHLQEAAYKIYRGIILEMSAKMFSIAAEMT